MAVFPALSFAEQAVYYAVRRLTCRVMKCIFNPIKLTSDFYYNRKLHRDTLKQTNLREIQQTSVAFEKLLRIAVLLGCSLLIIGLSYSRLLAEIYAGSLLVNWPWLMKMQFVVLFLMGTMDITVTYANSLRSRTINEKDLELYFGRRRWLRCIALSISGFLSYFIGWFGFTIVNCFKLGSQILHSLWVIRCDLNGTTVRPNFDVLPNFKEVFAFGAALSITVLSELFIYPLSMALHLASGVISAAIVLKVIVVTEIGDSKQVFTFLRRVFWDSQ